MNTDVDTLRRTDSWDGVHAVVIGIGASGFAAADNLMHVGASVTVLAESATPVQQEKAELLEVLGATVRIGTGASATLPDRVDVLVTSPGVPPTAPALAAAYARGVPVWGEVEPAWRLRDPEHPGRWLCVTGTNGKTTTVQMLDSILRAAGVRSIACGNVGLPIVEAVMDPEPYAVYAVELSSFQLHYTHTMAAESAAVLNVAEDHLDWYTGPDGMADYAADKGRIYERVRTACVYNVADPVTEQLVRDADVEEGAGRSASRSARPASAWSGLVEDVLADRAFIEERASTPPSCARSATSPPTPRTSWPTRWPPRRPGPVGRRPAGRRPRRAARLHPRRAPDRRGRRGRRRPLRRRLQGHQPARGQVVAAGLRPGRLGRRRPGQGRVVRRPRRRRARPAAGVVLLGRDRAVIAEALARHAPDVRVIEVEGGDTSVMDRVVGAAADLAQPGDTVLLAPGCASMDMFANYGARGDAFAESVRRLRDR